MKRVKNKLTRLKTWLGLAMTTIMLSPVGAFADVSSDSAEWTGGDDINGIIGNVIGMVLAIGQAVGMVLVIIGIVRIVLALKQDDSNAQSQGIQLAVVGALLVGLRALLSAAGLIS